jgi:hypothetical protein
MQFALMIYHTPEEFAMRTNDYNHPHLGAWRAYYKVLVEAGVYVGANALEVPETGTTVRLKEGKRRVQDGMWSKNSNGLKCRGLGSCAGSLFEWASPTQKRRLQSLTKL